jgi:hypothetical protein
MGDGTIFRRIIDPFVFISFAGLPGGQVPAFGRLEAAATGPGVSQILGT